jgi:hypothetical protein
MNIVWSISEYLIQHCYLTSCRECVKTLILFNEDSFTDCGISCRTGRNLEQGNNNELGDMFQQRPMVI